MNHPGRIPSSRSRFTTPSCLVFDLSLFESGEMNDSSGIQYSIAVCKGRNGLWEPLLFKDVKMSRNFQSRVPPKCWDSLD